MPLLMTTVEVQHIDCVVDVLVVMLWHAPFECIDWVVVFPNRWWR